MQDKQSKRSVREGDVVIVIDESKIAKRKMETGTHNYSVNRWFRWNCLLSKSVCNYQGWKKNSD